MSNSRINECKDMEEYHTSMSLKASKEGDISKAKEHARKAQAYRQEANKLLSMSEFSDRQYEISPSL